MGNPAGTSCHSNDGIWGKLDSVEARSFFNIGLKAITTIHLSLLKKLASAKINEGPEYTS